MAESQEATAVCLKLQQRFEKGNGVERISVAQEEGPRAKRVPVTGEDLQDAVIEIIRQLEDREFHNEKEILHSRKIGKELMGRDDARKRNMMIRTSVLYRLDPFIDKDGILSAGGWIKKS